MTTTTGGTRSAPASPRALTLVWIDAREAIVVRRPAGAAVFAVIRSDVPAHHRATGHVRHEPGIRHGGGGRPQTAGEPHRLEHLARYVDAVAGRLPRDDDVLVLGPGTVREHLVRRLAEDDARRHAGRSVGTEASARLSHRQLAARLAELSGEPPRRQTVGNARWTSGSASGPEAAPPRAGRDA